MAKEVKETVEEIKNEVKDEIKEVKDSTKEELKDIKTDVSKVIDNVKEEVKSKVEKKEIWLVCDENTQVLNVIGGCVIKTKEGLCFVPHNHFEDSEFKLIIA